VKAEKHTPETDKEPEAPHPRETFSFVGHEAEEQALFDGLRGGRMHHAWLLAGAKGLGKATLAYRFARVALGAKPGGPRPLDTDPEDQIARRIAAQSHPDLFVLRRGLNDRGKPRREITVDEARELSGFFALAPSEGGMRVAIIDALNAAIAKGMELINDIRGFITSEKLAGPVKGADDPTLSSRHALSEAFELVVICMAPFAPHTSEELHAALGHKQSVFDRPWPKPDADAMKLDEVEMPVQVNGKVRGTITLPREADKATMEKLALENENVKRFVEGKAIQKLIVVPGRIINVVAK
jgi:DNA polymerase III gamma/tau subunit